MCVIRSFGEINYGLKKPQMVAPISVFLQWQLDFFLNETFKHNFLVFLIKKNGTVGRVDTEIVEVSGSANGNLTPE